MARYNGRIVFVDGFAGPGRYEGGEEGSPLIALRTLLDHPAFVHPAPGLAVTFLFIEEDQDRHTALRAEIAQLNLPAWVTVRVENADFEPTLAQLLDVLAQQQESLAPTFAFIDPFGFSHVSLDIIKRILGNPRCECLITFMFEAVNRFLSHPSPKLQAHFDSLFGTTKWRELLRLPAGEQRRSAIVNLYRNQLEQYVGATFVRTFEMIDDGNNTEYFLYFATRDPKGLSKMKEAMWRADPTGGQQFSDFTVSDQMVLLQPEADTALLSQLLTSKFRGGGFVSIDVVAYFVLSQTPFCENIHLKRATLKPMEEQGLIEVVRPVGKRVRPGDYPPGTKLRFL